MQDVSETMCGGDFVAAYPMPGGAPDMSAYRQKYPIRRTMKPEVPQTDLSPCPWCGEPPVLKEEVPEWDGEPGYEGNSYRVTCECHRPGGVGFCWRVGEGALEQTRFDWEWARERQGPKKPSPTDRKLSDDEVRAIRAEYGAPAGQGGGWRRSVSYTDLAERFGVSVSTIGNVVNRRTYSDVPDSAPASP